MYIRMIRLPLLITPLTRVFYELCRTYRTHIKHVTFEANAEPDYIVNIGTIYATLIGECEKAYDNPPGKAGSTTQKE